MLIFSYLLLTLTAAYATALFYMARGLSVQWQPVKHDFQPNVSVVIAARNEAANIGNCLSCVMQQDYPVSRFEVVVVDDASSDHTSDIVKDWQRRYPNLRLLELSNEMRATSPKKHAISQGVAHASGEIIVTTDADCLPPSTWIGSLVRQMTDDVGMVAGFNPYQAPDSQTSLPFEMLALDYFAMAAVAAASAGIQFPVSCTGGNLAYRKQLYEELDGFGEAVRLSSGDDDLFLKRVRDETRWKIRYITSPDSFVPTTPPANLREFVQQRLRYASKGFAYGTKTVTVLVAVFLLNAMLFTAAILAPASSMIAASAGLAFLLKSVSEFLFLRRAGQRFGVSFSVSTFITTAILHPFYLVLASVAGQVLDFTWKERNLST